MGLFGSFQNASNGGPPSKPLLPNGDVDEKDFAREPQLSNGELQKSMQSKSEPRFNTAASVNKKMIKMRFSGIFS
jgi:hypothetical protein